MTQNETLQGTSLRQKQEKQQIKQLLTGEETAATITAQLMKEAERRHLGQRLRFREQRWAEKNAGQNPYTELAALFAAATGE